MQAMHGELFGALLAVSASADVASRRIPNLLPASIAAAGMTHAISAGGLRAVPANLAAGLLVAAVLILAWRARLLGGGDVKLATACALWVGPNRLASFAAATAIAGGLVALWSLAMALRDPLGALAPATSDGETAAARVRVTAASIPYGVAIAVGALFAIRG